MKAPSGFPGGGLWFQIRLELVDDVGREHEGVLLVATGSEEARTVTRIVVPAELRAADHVLPEFILDRGRGRECFIMQRRAEDVLLTSVLQVLAASMDAEFFRG